MSLTFRVHTLPALGLLSMLTAATLLQSNMARAAAIDENIPDSQTLAQLELRASQASPRDQPFLYTQLIHTMTEMAGKQLSAGDSERRYMKQSSMTVASVIDSCDRH